MAAPKSPNRFKFDVAASPAEAAINYLVWTGKQHTADVLDDHQYAMVAASFQLTAALGEIQRLTAKVEEMTGHITKIRAEADTKIWEAAKGVSAERALRRSLALEIQAKDTVISSLYRNLSENQRGRRAADMANLAEAHAAVATKLADDADNLVAENVAISTAESLLA